MAIAPNTGFGLLNPGTTTPPPAAPSPQPPVDPGFQLQPDQPPPANTGYGMLNPGTTNPAPPPPPPSIDANGNYVDLNGNPVAPPPYAPGQQPTGPQTIGDLLNGFPGYQNSLALEQQGMGQLDAWLQAQRERAIINFGDPALAQLAGFGLDPQAGAFAQQNYLSGNATLARLDKAHQLNAQNVINQLAAHGILNSGDLGYREGQENQGYGNNVYDAQQNVLQYLANLYNTYLGQRNGLETNANNAQLNALTQFLSNPDLYSGLFGQQQQPQATSVGPPAASVAKKAVTNYKGVKGPAIGAFK